MSAFWQLLANLRNALLQSPRLALTAVMGLATLAPLTGLISILMKDRRSARRRPTES